ncbi:MAG: reverse transcriptase, partial [Proteobacteria bacterium]|nr:reverse transcriptase [Pseudomonadota bacterium]
MDVLEKNGNLGKLDSWPPETAKKAKRLLVEFHHIFSLEPNEIGCTDAAEHVIELLPGQDEPFKERFRRIAPHNVEEVRQHVQEMLDGGAIRPSQSPWCNAVMLVRKKDGSLRFCIDFRRLNARTKKDSHPIPRGPETIESLVGARYFSTMDLKSGFWQVKVADDSRQYTAFTVGSMGIYEFLRMPYGLCNAPATFQRLMQNCLGELNLTFALVYLDDVIVYSRTPEEHLKRLHAVFDHFTQHGLKLKPSKCHFFKETINYLGHKISAEGMLPGEDGIKDIAKMAPPTTVTGVRRFIGATGYFRRFIKNFARIAKPLNDLVGCENAKLKNHPVVLSEAALEAFETLKKKCITAPVLAFADLEKTFRLQTDASGDGLGAVLEQMQDDGKYHPVAYASRSLSKSEKNYHSSKLEFLALKWAVTEQFKEYLLYKPFTVRTDNNPLTYILTTPNLDATGHRWVSALADFNMKIEYLKGADNKVADALSRIEARLDTTATDQFLKSVREDTTAESDVEPEGRRKVDEDAVNEIMERAKFPHVPRAEADNPALLARHEELQQQVAVDLATLVTQKNIKHNLVGTNWRELQQKDPVLQHVLTWKDLNSFKLKTKKDKNKANLQRQADPQSTDRRTLEQYLSTVINPIDAKIYGNRQKDLVMFNGLLYLRENPAGG